MKLPTAKLKELTYASPNDPKIKRWLIGTIESLSGREKFLPLYRYWRNHIVPKSPTIFCDMLDVIDCKLDLDAKVWPPRLEANTPLVMIANHPFGIGDGISILALAEQLGRPFKVIINNQLLRIPEVRPFSLPIDFDETREAQVMNLKTRKEALALIAAGTTVVVFPAGGVATAKTPFGRAADLPWKLFTAKLIQSAKATVLPVYFEGQNGPLFHLVSRISLTLRLSLLVSEFRKFEGSSPRIRIGDLVPFDQLKNPADRKALTDELHDLVFALARPEEEDLRRRKLRRVTNSAKRRVQGVGRLARQKMRRAGRLAKRKILNPDAGSVNGDQPDGS